MDNQTARPSLTKPRVRRLWNCSLGSDLGYIFLTVLLVIVIGLPLSCIIFIASQANLSGSFATPISAACSIGVIVCIMYLVERIRPRGKSSWNRFRLKRLKWIVERPDAIGRLPHRFLELHQLGHSKRARGMKKHLSKVQPGETILIDCPREIVWPMWRSQIAFEPIQWESSEPLIESWHAERSDAANSVRPAHVASIRSRINGVLPFFGWIAILAMSVGSLVRSTMRGQSLISSLNWSHAYLVVALVSLMMGAYRYLLVGRAYYLVPGGMVRLENGLMFRTPRLELLTPENTSLVMYAEGGTYFITGGKVTFVSSDESMIVSLLVAWLSQARAPTMQELRTLLAPETLAAVRSARSSESA